MRPFGSVWAGGLECATPMQRRPIAFEIRPATVADGALLGAFRAAQQAETHAPADGVEAYAAVCSAFFARELAAEGSYVRAWIAYAGERAVGSAVLTTAPSLPRLGRAASLDGRVRSVYVIPELRRCGIGAALTRAAIEGAEAAGIDRLTLGLPSQARRSTRRSASGRIRAKWCTRSALSRKWRT